MKLIGEILCKMSCLRHFQLEQALQEQQQGKKLPLGQILVKHGYITEIQLESALKIQEKINKAPSNLSSAKALNKQPVH